MIYLKTILFKVKDNKFNDFFFEKVEFFKHDKVPMMGESKISQPTSWLNLLEISRITLPMQRNLKKKKENGGSNIL